MRLRLTVSGASGQHMGECTAPPMQPPLLPPLRDALHALDDISVGHAAMTKADALKAADREVQDGGQGGTEVDGGDSVWFTRPA